MTPGLLWRAYGQASLALRPHTFFSKLTQLDWYCNTLLTWVDWIEPGAGSRLLELGCSGGALCRSLAVREYTVVGLDRSARAIRQACRANQRTNLDFVVGNAVALPFRDSCFTCTLAASLLNVVGDPQKLVAEMARVTAVDGLVSLLFPTPHMQLDTARAFLQRNDLRGFSAAAILLWATKARKLLPNDATALLASTGLRDIRNVGLLDGMVHAIVGRKLYAWSP